MEVPATTQGIGARITLGQRIKRERERCSVNNRKLTQTALGKRLGWSQGKIQKMEDAKVRIDPGDVERIIDELDIDPTIAEEMRSLAALNAPLTPSDQEQTGAPGYVQMLIEDEQRASEILSWHELRIPGPLQSEPYMLKLFNTAGTTDVTALIRTRTQRKRLFRQPQLRRYDCVLAEEALHRAATGLGHGIARDQIEQLMSINECDDPSADTRISVRVLPMDAPVPWLPGDFSLLHFPNRRSYVYIESMGRAQYLKFAHVVRQASADHWNLSRAALDQAGTRKLLEKLHHEFDA